MMQSRELGYSLIELSLTIALVAILTIKSQAAVQMELEELALRQIVESMQDLARTARNYQDIDANNEWPDSVAVLNAAWLGEKTLASPPRHSFGGFFDFEVASTSDAKMKLLRISTVLAKPEHALFVTRRLGALAYSDNTLAQWTVLPRSFESAIPKHALDAAIDLNGAAILGLNRIANTAFTMPSGRFLLNRSALKVDRIVVRNLVTKWLSWIDQPKYRPLYQEKYRNTNYWPEPDFFASYMPLTLGPTTYDVIDSLRNPNFRPKPITLDIR